MHDEWREFIAGLGVPVDFLHKDELLAQYGLDDVSLPAAFSKSEEGTLSSLLDSETLNSLASLDELKSVVAERVAEIR